MRYDNALKLSGDAMKSFFSFLVLMFVVFCFHPTTARADAVANINQQGRLFFGSAASGTQARVDLNQNLLIVITERERKKIKLPLKLLKYGNFYISDDGSWVVWVLKAYALSAQGEDLFGNSPILISFHNGQEVQRISYNLLRFKNKSSSVSHVHWANISNPNFTTQEIYLSEPGDERHARVNWATGKVIVTLEEKSTPKETSQEQQPLNDLKKAAEWYQSELKNLNAKADQMPDKDLNQAMEKLTADYNRKLLKISVQSIPPKSSTTPPPLKSKQPISPPAKMVEAKVYCDFDDEVIEFILPAGNVIYSAIKSSDSIYSFYMKTALVKAEAAMTLTVTKLTDKKSEKSKNPEQDTLQIKGAKHTYQFDVQNAHSEAKDTLKKISKSFKSDTRN